MKFEKIVKQFQHNIFGILTTIRSFKNNNKIWFLGAEIQKLLGHTNLTQAIKDGGLNSDEFFVYKKSNNPEFFKELTKQSLVGYGKRSSSITFVSESGLYKLILRSNKPEAKIFADWVTGDVLPSLRQSVEEHINFKNSSVEISKHLDIEQQKTESKIINKFNYDSGGTNKTIKYNRDSCFDHSGFTPRELKEWAEKHGVSSSKRSSGKEVLRIFDMPTAASMSLTDNLVSNGVPYEKALPISKGAGKELFKQMIEIGVKPKELDS